MLKVSLVFALAVMIGFCQWFIHRRLARRIHGLARDLQHLSDVVSQMADMQMKTFDKHAASFEELEERIMELSIPSHDSNLPLERRHQVLTLARQGHALEDIVKRLKAPVGEAELILNLRKYMGGESARSTKMNEQVGKYA
ncbi:MAG: hypothetical protein JXA73_26855 [Acidobacteria bacterium]|nr:hypothetical protein [Acidobacteriota bacterium]